MYNLASGNLLRDESDFKSKLLSLDEHVSKTFEELDGQLRAGIPASNGLRIGSNIKSKNRRRNRQKVGKKEEEEEEEETVGNEDTETERTEEEFVDLNNRFAMLLS
jgi:hypothetical protein